MTSSGGPFIPDRELHSPASNGKGEDRVDVDVDDILQSKLLALPTFVETLVSTTPVTRCPRTRSETWVRRRCSAIKDIGDANILPQRQCRKKNGATCLLSVEKKDCQPSLAQGLRIGEQGVLIASDAEQPKAKRKYHRRTQPKASEPSPSSAQGTRRGRGRPRTCRGVSLFSTQGLCSDDSNNCIERVVPTPVVFFLPPATRSKGAAKASYNHQQAILQNLQPDGQLTTGGIQNSLLEIQVSHVYASDELNIMPVPHTCLVKISLINMLWGGEVLENPCGFAFGRVLRSLEGTNAEDRQLLCDFGGDFGVQIVAERDCEFPTEGSCGGDSINVAHTTDNTKAQAKTTRDLVVILGASKNGVHTFIQGSTSAQVVQDNLSSEEEWQPNIDDLCSSGDGYSDGDSFDGIFPQDSPTALLGELGLYSDGPKEEHEEFLSKYNESNWHTKTWSLLPRHAFTGPTPGARGEVRSQPFTPTEFFLQIWNEHIQRRIVYYSNSYANYVDPKSGKRKGGVHPSAPITLQEYRQFCGIVILMGIKKQPTIRDYWQRVGNFLHCASIASTMSRFRFEYILRCLYMVPKGSFVTDKEDPAYDPLGKCRWILDVVTATFKALWNPGPYVSIDECMIGYNGKYCSFKQYMPLKPITHGIKLWVLADSRTKFVWNMEVYVGAGNERRALEVHPNPMGMGAAVVTRLTAGIDGMFYRVAMDNFFSSVKLFDNLLQRGFYAIGTTRQQRQGFPSSLSMTGRETRGSLQIRVHRDRQMAAIHWQDTKGVHFLSTSKDPMVSGGVSVLRNKGAQRWQIPTSPIQLAYSEHMRGVDVSDQLRGSYSAQIATKKWWHRVYFFAMDTVLTNAYVMYREDCGVRGIRPKIHRDFNLEVAYCLMGLPVPEVGNGSSKVQPRHESNSSCSTMTNGAVHTPHVATNRRVCFVCRKRTFYVCQKCLGTRLCRVNCFNYYHEGPPTL